MDARAIAPLAWIAARERSGEVARAWHRSADWLALADMFDDVAASSLAIARDRAVALLADDRWATRLLTPLTEALAQDPLFEPPLRVSRERGRIGAVLFEAPAARIAASVLSARKPDQPAIHSVVVPGHVSATRYVRAGAAHIRRWRMAADRIEEIAPLFPADGDIAVHDGRTEGQGVAHSSGDMVTLTIILRAHAAPVAREYRVADGTALRTASTDDGASRSAMLLTLLRVSERADAAEVFDAATRGDAPHARWSAMREWLALDADAALPRLAEMAASDDDAEVRDLATTTQAMVERRRAACRG